MDDDELLLALATQLVVGILLPTPVFQVICPRAAFYFHWFRINPALNCSIASLEHERNHRAARLTIASSSHQFEPVALLRHCFIGTLVEFQRSVSGMLLTDFEPGAQCDTTLQRSTGSQVAGRQVLSSTVRRFCRRHIVCMYYDTAALH
ncbi:hypothetical protein LY76DRAFT_373433 [Colletotrichum caudatum]|nr:hypothetical protein LY76DRAFT_373433 [Colletotrichum caudatum]